jgi:hypothetical protein
MMDKRQVKYVNTAALWRDLAYMRANRRRMEEVVFINGVPPFNYHERRREILKVLAARTARKAA